MTKNENQQTIGYKKKMEENRELLRQIGEKLKAIDESQSRYPDDWGYNGSAGSTHLLSHYAFSIFIP